MAAVADTSDKSSSMAKADDATDSARIGWAFLSQYYSYLNKDPARLHCFYTKRSTLIHSTEGEETVACYGQQEIHAKIMSLAFEDCKVYISNVDSQSSAEGGIIVQVIGEMSNSSGPWRKFAQTFFLAEQPNGYFVLNDICRYIKEEGDEEIATPAPTTNNVAPSTQSEQTPSSSTANATTSASSTEDVPPVSVESVLFKGVKPNEEDPQQQKEEETTTAVSSEPTTADSSFTLPSQSTEAVKTNGKVAVADKVEEPVVEASVVEPISAVEEKSNHSTPAEAAPAALAEAKQQSTSTAAPSSTPAASSTSTSGTPASTSAASTSTSAPAPSSSTPVATSAPTAPPAPTPAPAPAAPAAPKSWASLAASNTNKWGSLNRGAASTSAQKSADSSSSSAPTSTSTAPSSSTTPTTSQQQQQRGSGESHQFSDQVMAVSQPGCFVKGVVEFVTDKQLKDVLTTRFGPLKEIDIVRTKACAFVEFVHLSDARRAIQVSLRHSEGGENGITFETPSGDKARINVVERKPHNERPPTRPHNAETGGGSASGAGGGGGGGQGGGRGGGAKGGQKDGQRTGGGQGGQQGSRVGGGGGQRNNNNNQQQGRGAGRNPGGGNQRQNSGQAQK